MVIIVDIIDIIVIIIIIIIILHLQPMEVVITLSYTQHLYIYTYVYVHTTTPGGIWNLVCILCLLAAVTSAFLDNVATFTFRPCCYIICYCVVYCVAYNILYHFIWCHMMLYPIIWYYVVIHEHYHRSLLCSSSPRWQYAWYAVCTMQVRTQCTHMHASTPGGHHKERPQAHLGGRGGIAPD